MALKPEPSTEIALNVTRTHMTVLVFNMTVTTFMISMMKGKMGTNVSASAPHPASAAALYVGFCLTVLGIFWLLNSQKLDPQGLSRPWPFTLGTMTMYLALSQTITAFIYEFLLELETVTEASRAGVAESSQNLISLHVLADNGLWILVAMGGAIWVLTTYAAPFFASLRSPVSPGQRWVLLGYYVVLQAPIYWVYANAWQLQHVPTEQPSNVLVLFALQFAQPILWFR